MAIVRTLGLTMPDPRVPRHSSLGTIVLMSVLGTFLRGWHAEGSSQSADPFTWRGLQYTGMLSTSSQELTDTGGVSGVSTAISVSQRCSASTFPPNFSGEPVSLKMDLVASGTGQPPYSSDSVTSVDALHKLFISSAVTGAKATYFDFGTGNTVVIDEARFTGFSRVPEPASWIAIIAFGASFFAYRLRKAIA